MTEWEELNLLEGEANLYFEGTYVGKTLMNVRGMSDTMDISLGPDRNLIVSRTKVKTDSKDQFIGNNRKESRIWEIEVRNQKENKPVHLIIEGPDPAF